MTVEALRLVLQNDKRYLSMMLVIKEINGGSGYFDREALIDDIVKEVSEMIDFGLMRDKEALRLCFWLLYHKMQHEFIEFFHGPLLKGQ